MPKVSRLEIGGALLTLLAVQVPLGAQTRFAQFDARRAAALLPAPAKAAAPRPIASTGMSCGTARLISAPLGAGAGALGTFVLYEMLSASTTSARTPTAGPDLRPAGLGDRGKLMLVGGTLGLILGIAAPPVARQCWISLPGRPGNNGGNGDGGGGNSAGGELTLATENTVPQGRLGITNY
jgi:hypothetical protein